MKISFNPHFSQSTVSHLSRDIGSKAKTPSWQKITAITASVALPLLAFSYYLYSRHSNDSKIQEWRQFADKTDNEFVWYGLGMVYEKSLRDTEAYESYLIAAKKGSILAMHSIEKYWREGRISTTEEEKSQIRNAFDDLYGKKMKARMQKAFTSDDIRSWETLGFDYEIWGRYSNAYEAYLKAVKMGSEFAMDHVERLWDEELVNVNQIEKVNLRNHFRKIQGQNPIS